MEIITSSLSSLRTLACFHPVTTWKWDIPELLLVISKLRQHWAVCDLSWSHCGVELVLRKHWSYDLNHKSYSITKQYWLTCTVMISNCIEAFQKTCGVFLFLSSDFIFAFGIVWEKGISLLGFFKAQFIKMKELFWAGLEKFFMLVSCRKEYSAVANFRV